jgi:cytoskeleton protein RodZ
MAKVTPLPPEKRDEFARQQVRGQDGPEPAASQSVGEYLRAVRCSRGQDLGAASRALRIRKDHLEAIEDNRLDDLPGRAYAIGFIRSYAAWLGLDGNECVDRFKAETGGRAEQSPLRGLPDDTGESRLPYGWLFMALIVLGVVGYAGYHLVHSAEFNSAPQPVAPVPAVMRAETAKHVAMPRRAVHAPPPVKTASSAPAPGAATNGVAPAAGANSAAPAGATTPPANSALAALPQGQTFGQQNKNARVVLHARAVTHVLVEGPGGRVFINRILHPGDAYRVPDLVGLSLTTPDGGAVLLELDGQEVSSAGRAGQMTEALSLDPQAIVDRAHGGNPG